MLPDPKPRDPDSVRFYVDEDILGIGYGMMWLRPDVTTCGQSPFAAQLPRGIHDVDWIPMTSALGLVAVTANSKIRTNPVEASVAVSCGARIIGLGGRSGQRTSWQTVTLLTRHWQAIETFIKENPEGPWWLSVTQAGIRQAEYNA